MAVPGHGMFRQRLFSFDALDEGLRAFGFGYLRDSLGLARPPSDGEAFEDIVVDLAGSGAVGALAKLTARTRGPELEIC